MNYIKKFVLYLSYELKKILIHWKINHLKKQNNEKGYIEKKSQFTSEPLTDRVRYNSLQNQKQYRKALSDEFSDR